MLLRLCIIVIYYEFVYFQNRLFGLKMLKYTEYSFTN